MHVKKVTLGFSLSLFLQGKSDETHEQRDLLQTVPCDAGHEVYRGRETRAPGGQREGDGGHHHPHQYHGPPGRLARHTYLFMCSNSYHL